MKSLFLVPMPLSIESSHHNISQEVKELLLKVNLIVAEKARTFRRFVRDISPDIDISQLNIIEIPNSKNGLSEKDLIQSLEAHDNIALVSEAGCPGIADPGSTVTLYAHQKNCQVKAISGPSSIFLALMASGMNGQNFSFHGYLPRKSDALAQKLKQIERTSAADGSAQIFMETPYRNMQMLSVLLKTLKPTTHLHISSDLTGPKEYVKTMKIIQWQDMTSLELHKKPCIFILSARIKQL